MAETEVKNDVQKNDVQKNEAQKIQYDFKPNDIIVADESFLDEDYFGVFKEETPYMLHLSSRYVLKDGLVKSMETETYDLKTREWRKATNFEKRIVAKLIKRLAGEIK